jgi:peptide-methionine (S)-S-oxide reductase
MPRDKATRDPKGELMSIQHPLTVQPRPGNEFATLAGGCFWCLEAVFEDVEGVVDVESGYTGGSVERPSYRQVCEGTTGHAEVVRIEFEPARISYRELLEIFFSIHDPTTLNRQGNDVGTQYRSAIYYHSSEQRSVAQDVIRELESHLEHPVVTEVADAGTYWRAEDYHQEYFRNNPAQGYCMFVVAPKVVKFRKTFAAKRRKSAGD